MNKVLDQAELDKLCLTCGKFMGNHHWSDTLANGIPLCPVEESVDEYCPHGKKFHRCGECKLSITLDWE